MFKNFKLAETDIQPLAEGYGTCLATNMITVEGYLFGFMYREEPEHEDDSG